MSAEDAVAVTQGRQSLASRLHYAAGSERLKGDWRTQRLLSEAARTLAATRPSPGIMEYRAALESVRDWLRSAPLESGYCCCGSPVKGHGFGDGHSPVDELAYSSRGQIEQIEALLAMPSEEKGS